MRTFIAIDVGESIRQKAVALQQTLARLAPGVKWVEEANLHITLMFLGEATQFDVNAICRVVKDKMREVPSFTLELGGLEAFPNARRPKILWAGVAAGATQLKQIHAMLEEPVLRIGGFRRENRAFAPHLTLGRLSAEDRSDDWSPHLAEYADWHGGTVAIDEVLVMSSELQREGPVYSVMGRGKLGGG